MMMKEKTVRESQFNDLPMHQGQGRRRPIASRCSRVIARALLPVSMLGLAACSEQTSGTGGAEPGYVANLPEDVLAIVAPNQNLNAVQLRPEDGCYWYRHDGPVETTMLPLRTTAGNPICTRAQG